MNKNWRVRIYVEGSQNLVADSWVIENRTESEAESEAMADIGRAYPEDVDWTMVEVGSEADGFTANGRK